MGHDDLEIGSIEVITGPMFAGKSEELLRRINRLKYAKKKFLVFKPTIDNRYSETEVVSHSKRSSKAIAISQGKDIYKYFTDDINCVCIDEVQFFDEGIIEVIDDLANVSRKDPVVLVGASESYEARCRHCHIVKD